METNDMVKRKSEMRRRLVVQRGANDIASRERADAIITRRVARLAAFAKAELLLTYLDFGSEVRTRDLIELAWSAEKVVALPRCVAGTHEVSWHRIDSYEQLERGSYGMLEPDPDLAPLVEPTRYEHAVAIVPGLTFDARGYRLGYGGGYYDVFLSTFTGVSIGLCRAHCMTNSLASLGVISPHDLPVDVVITD